MSNYLIINIMSLLRPSRIFSFVNYSLIAIFNTRPIEDDGKFCEFVCGLS